MVYQAPGHPRVGSLGTTGGQPGHHWRPAWAPLAATLGHSGWPGPGT